MRHSTTLFLLLLSHFCLGQIPNPSFESWAAGVPEAWAVNNVDILGFSPVTQSSQAYSGSLAVRGEVVENPILDFPSPPLLQNAAEIPVNGPVPSLDGYYIFQPLQSTTSFVVSCTAQDANNMMTGFGVLNSYEAQPQYTAFSIPMDYSLGSNEPTVKVSIAFTIADDNGEYMLGSFFLVDQLSFDGATSVFDEFSLENVQVYPNPALDHIWLELPRVVNTLTYELSDLQGRVVSNGQFLESTSDGRFLVDIPTALSGGIYSISFWSGEGQRGTERFLLRR